MSRLDFTIIGARVEPYAAVPTLMLRLRITEASDQPVHAMMLRCQIQIEPRRRHYAPAEQERLLELFGELPRWGDTLHAVVWTHVALMVPGFQGSVEVDMPVTCTYDFEVAAAKYLHALDDGEIPLLLLFSGTIFFRGETGVSVEQVSWDKEAAYPLPAQLWREVMDRYFPGSAWIRLRRDSFDALFRFKGRHALPTWDDAIEILLQAAGEKVEV